MPVRFDVNGESHTSHADPMTPLIDVLRNELSLKGAKDACRSGVCGACMVWIDNLPAVSCLTPLGCLEGASVTTIEAMAIGDALSPLQKLLIDFDAVQCGMCFPGMVMTLQHHLDLMVSPSRDEIKAVMSGNICRCTGYERIVDAAWAYARQGEAQP